jgi:hypothetical protein
MEIWTLRDTSAHPSKDFVYRLILLQTIVFLIFFYFL